MPKKKRGRPIKIQVLRIRGERKGQPYTRTFRSESEMRDCISRYNKVVEGRGNGKVDQIK